MAEAATGFLHIVRLTGAVDPVIVEYRIAFAPLVSNGRTSPSAALPVSRAVFI
jgi:hypothetical protein